MKEYTIGQKIVTMLTVLLLIGVTVLFFVRYPAVPQIVPTHFGWTGQPDAWGDKSIVIGLLVILYVLYLSVLITGFFPQIWNVPVRVTEDNRRYIYRQLRWMIVMAQLGIVSMFSYLIVCNLWERYPGVWFFPAVIVLLMAVVGVPAMRMVQYARKHEKE